MSNPLLISPLTPLGSYIEYSLSPADRLQYIQEFAPPEISYQSLWKIFKKDILLDTCIECINDATVYYIVSTEGRGDELYYFSSNGLLFHGEKVWSRFHSFLPHLSSIKPSTLVSTPSWFVGSRNNYTHQVVDFIPSLIYKAVTKHPNISEPCTYIYGCHNSILDSLLESPLISGEWNKPKLFLDQLGSPTRIGAWEIRGIHFKKLYLVKHMSVFKAFLLIKTAFNYVTSVNSLCEEARVLYLSRGDGRVENQNTIESHLLSHWNAGIMRNAQELSYYEKIMAISKFSHIILPPGSDNINGLCFSPESSFLYQLIPTALANILSSPFTSYAGLRYLLPFLHRTTFIPALPVANKTELYSGSWDLSSIDFSRTSLSL